jgi:hypothetical protein
MLSKVLKWAQSESWLPLPFVENVLRASVDTIATASAATFWNGDKGLRRWTTSTASPASSSHST